MTHLSVPLEPIYETFPRIGICGVQERWLKSWERALTDHSENPGFCASTCMAANIVCNSIFRKTNLLFSPLWALHTCGLYIHAGKCLYTGNKNNKSLLKRVCLLFFSLKSINVTIYSWWAGSIHGNLHKRLFLNQPFFLCAFRGYILCSLVCLNMYTCVHGDHRTPSCFFFFWGS